MFAQPVAPNWNWSGALLVLSGVLMIAGVTLWTGRNMWAWRAATAPAFQVWERGLIMAAIVAAMVGFVLLARLLQAAGDPIWARVGVGLYLLGALFGLAAEVLLLSKGTLPHLPIVAYVVLAFVGQAVLGVSLLQTGLLPGWIGWTTLVTNLGLLAVLPLVSPHDIYYPAAHHLAPLLIGIALLLG